MELDKTKYKLKITREKYANTQNLGVSIIAAINKPKYFNNIIDNYLRINYQLKELIIILNNNKFDLQKCVNQANEFENIRIFQLDESCTLGECLNFGIEKSRHEYIAKLDDDDYYGTNYLIDLMNVFKYTTAQVTGKTTRFIYFEDTNTLGLMYPDFENTYINVVAGGTILAKKEVFDKIKFRKIKTNGTDSAFIRDCNFNKIKLYSADRYNYVYMRHGIYKGHTWRVTPKEIMKYSKKITLTSNFIPLTTA